MPLTGDWARLKATIRGVQALGQVPSRMAPAAAVAIQAEIDRSFDTATDPYGQRWAPHQASTVRRWGAHKLLQLTGEGRAQIRVRAMPGKGIAITSPSEGLAFSQGGTRNQVPRRFLPLDRMPKTWRIALEKAAEAQIKEAFRGAR